MDGQPKKNECNRNLLIHFNYFPLDDEACPPLSHWSTIWRCKAFGTSVGCWACPLDTRANVFIQRGWSRSSENQNNFSNK